MLRFIVFLLINISCVPKAEVNSEALDSIKWEFERIEGQVLYFKEGRTFKTTLYDLSYIGQLKTKDKAPYLVLSGKTCENCGEYKSIFIHSPSDGEMKSGNEIDRYSYPGKEYEMGFNDPVFESRFFYGQCSPDYENSIIWLQNFQDAEGKWRESLYVVTVENDTLSEVNVVGQKEIADFKKTVEINKCMELEGIERTIEP
jgi:hypothetical protein